jgi:Zn-dependent protease
MPVSPSRFRRGHTSDIIVSAAGPAMNLVLAALSIIAAALWIKYASGVGQPLFDNFQIFFIAGGFLNIFLALFNLLPVPPLDGSKILAGFSPWYRGLISHPNAQIISMMLFLLVFMKFSSLLMSPAMELSAAGIRGLVQLLP